MVNILYLILGICIGLLFGLYCCAVIVLRRKVENG